MGKDVDFFLNSMADDVADSARREFVRCFNFMRARCESPIEEIFLAALEHRIKTVFSHENVHFLRGDYAFGEGSPAPFNDAIFVYLQADVLEYRADFMFVLQADPGAQLRYVVVECDGHDYHERTKDQAARDRRRDREMAAQGITCLRYTGSEIWRDPGGCAETALDLAINKLYGAE